MTEKIWPFTLQLYETITPNPEKKDIKLVQLKPGISLTNFLPKVAENTTDIFDTDNYESEWMSADFTFYVQPGWIAPEFCATIAHRVFHLCWNWWFGLIALLAPVESVNREIFHEFFQQEFGALQRNEHDLTKKYKTITLLLT